MRQIILDVETTGKSHKEGHRVVEFGAVELINRKITGKKLHFYINPQRDIPDEVVKIHGITNERVKNEPIFAEVAQQILDFIKDTEILAHNSEFDAKFINNEIELCGRGKLWDYTQKITDTLLLSKSIDSEERKHSLDAVCDRYGVSREGREFHGALLDSELLAEVYLKMTEGMTDVDVKAQVEQTNWVRPEVLRFPAMNLKLAQPSASDRKSELEMQILVASKSKNKELEEKLKIQLQEINKEMGIAEPLVATKADKVESAPKASTVNVSPAMVAPKPKFNNSFKFLK